MPGFDITALTAPGRAPRFGARSTTGCDEFDYAPGQPNLFMLMNLKHFLVKEHGLKAGFELYRRVVTTAGGASLRRLKLESHHDFCVAHARTFHEIFPAGEPISLDPPRVIGAGNHRTLTNTTRSFYVACLDEAVVRGRSSIIEADGLALADFQGEELARIDDELEFDSAIFHRDNGDEIWAIDDGQPARTLASAFTLLGCRTDFFGDWFWESIHKYVGATLRGHLPPVPILIDENMPKTHREALDLMLPDAVEVIEIRSFETVRVGHLWSSVGIRYMSFHQKQNERFKWDYFLCSPGHSAVVREEMCRRADRLLGNSGGPTHVFLARKDALHRRIINRKEIETIAAEAGFTIVYPEEHGFVAQAALLRSARYVIAPEGSALFLNVFLKPGARVCILNHELTQYPILHAERDDIEVTILTGPQVGERRGSPQDVDYRIDQEVLRRFLADWLPGASSR
jgi:hypothetical protein